MPVCPKCSNTFPFRMMIDGKVRLLAKRKYCLECSPFGSRNTRKLHIPARASKKYVRDEIIVLGCSGCNRTYELLPHQPRGNYCGTCIVTLKRKVRRSKITSIFGDKCLRCGYDKCQPALKFHHVYPDSKKFSIAGSECRKWSVVEEELRKCILVCGNCHDEIHWFKLDVKLLFENFWRTAQVGGGDL